MAHARLNLQRMFDWVEQCVAAGDPCPADAAICERFGFGTTEAARTLLAELADAGHITIRGYGADRVVTLGRQRAATAPISRPVPTVVKVDPDVERTAARIADIVNRGRRPARAVVAENAAQLLATVTKPAAPAAAKPPKEPAMPAKSIQIPASCSTEISAIEQLAKDDQLSLGQAAAKLIARGLADPQPEAACAAQRAVTVDSIVADIGALFADLVARADRPDQSADLAAAIARAEAAEQRAAEADAKLAQLKAIFA